MQHKVVENYQFQQSKGFLQDGIETYLAKHTAQQKQYLLKKVNTKDQTDRKKYQILINEVGVLKALPHSFISQCMKMLKTSNNIYLVYDYCAGDRLQEFFTKGTIEGKEKKMKIAKNLLTVLDQLSCANIVHCNLNPKSIIVGQNNSFKVLNFLYAHNLQNKNEMPLKFQPSSTEYTAPEIKNQKKVYRNTDIYSLGIIFQKLFGKELLGDRNNEFLGFIKIMMNQDHQKRPSLKQIRQALQNKQTQKKQRKKSADYLNINNKMANFRKPNSMNENTSLSRKSSKNSNSDNQFSEKAYVQQILKRRNLALFLLELSENSLSYEKSETSLGILLGCLFLKISTRIITGILGFMKSESEFKNQIALNDLDDDVKKQFQKKPDYFKLLTILNKQATSQKRWFDQVMKSITPELDNEKQAVLSSDIQDSQLNSYIREYLKQIFNEQSIQSIADSQLERFYLMSEILYQGSYQKLFENSVSEQKISLDEQYMYIHARKMPKDEKIQSIKVRINKRK